jgi:GTPase SAR1 family protein
LIGVGKTSLVETLKKYLEAPNKVPENFLTEDNPDMHGTRIAEIYNNISIHNVKVKTIEVKKATGKVSLVKFVDDDNEDDGGNMMTNIGKSVLKIIDFGGNTEYTNLTKLFL